MARRYLEDVGSRGDGGNGNVSGVDRNLHNITAGGIGGGINNRINISSSNGSISVGGVSVVAPGAGAGVDVDVVHDVLDWSHPIYRSVRGYLGYEWGTFSDNCQKPLGLWPLSTTPHTIHHGLVEKYGALYKGSGTVTHRLSLYRTQPSKGGSATLGGGEDKGSSQHQDKGLDPQQHMSPSALVFGAGTVQWSFALSSFHDGKYIPTGQSTTGQDKAIHMTTTMIDRSFSHYHFLTRCIMLLRYSVIH